MNTPIPDDVLKQIQAKLSDNGQTLKIRYIDKDPSKGLLGVRITNAKKLMEEVWSMQILDRSTVSLAIGGFDNDHHVSLTGEDGETFLESIAAEIPRELWDLIPTAAASQQQAQGIGQVSEAIAQMEQLTQTLATTAEENAAASEEVSSQSEVTLKAASELYGHVHGDANVRANARTPVKSAAAPPPARNIIRLGPPSAKTRIAVDSDLAHTGTYRRF